MRKALLAVSFGTSYPETRKVTIEATEAKLFAAFPDRTLYRAWTSNIIRRKLKRTTGEAIDSVAEALSRMAEEGVEDLLIQTTHMLPGEEFEKITAALREGPAFAGVRLGAPLLAAPEDLLELCRVLCQTFPRREGEQLCLMGHGSDALSDNVYLRLQRIFDACGREDVAVGTVEFDPGFAPVLARLTEGGFHRARLAPLMIVAGDHANNDMAGPESDSWASRIRAAGFETECVLRGLGEYEGVQAMLVRHALAAGVWTA